LKIAIDYTIYNFDELKGYSDKSIYSLKIFNKLKKFQCEYLINKIDDEDMHKSRLNYNINIKRDL
jgi:hypothetical protein